MVVVEIDDGSATGVGEAVPYPRYNQDVEQTLNAIRKIAAEHGEALSRNRLLQVCAANAARNALDCALWDLEAKRSGTPVWDLAGQPEPVPALGAYSLSIDPPRQLAENARSVSHFPLLKIKLGGHHIIESVAAVREACPESRLIVDANEAWTIEILEKILPELKQLDVEMIEQPLPAGSDAALDEFKCEIPLCADESFHSVDDLDRLANRYEIFNIKLDKTGGLTAALEIANAVKAAGRQVMVGSMMATSLGLAPAMLLAHGAAYIDLDSSVWLAEDRPHGINFENGLLHPADPRLWG